MISSPRAVASCSFALAALIRSRSVAAAPVRHVELAWSQDDAACLAAVDLAAMVERTLARAVFHSDDPPFAKVVGAVGRAGLGRFEARISLRDMQGTVLAERRLVTSGDCGRLDESVAVVVALMIDGMEETPAALHVADVPPRPPPPAPLPAPVPRERPPAPRENPPALVALTAGIGAGVASWRSPSVVASFALRTELTFRDFVPIALEVQAPQTSFSVLLQGSGATFTVSMADLAACPGWVLSRVRVGGCAGVGVGALSEAYVGVIDGESHVAPLVQLTVLPFVAVRLSGPLWVRAEGGAWFSLVRQLWYLESRGGMVELYRAAPVVPAGALTLELQMGS